MLLTIIYPYVFSLIRIVSSLQFVADCVVGFISREVVWR